MKVIFETSDLELIYGRTLNSTNEGYFAEKLEAINSNYQRFYGYLDLSNQHRFMAMVSVPTKGNAESYVFEKLEEDGGDFTIQYTVPVFHQNSWFTRVVFTSGDEYTERHYDCWYEQGELYGEW